MSKTIREHICNIQVEKSNLEHIATTGQINGSLLISIEKAIRDYSQSQTQGLQEQNAELAKELAHVVKALKTVSSFGATTPIIEHAEGILTKHNHLNKK